MWHRALISSAVTVAPSLQRSEQVMNDACGVDAERSRLSDAHVRLSRGTASTSSDHVASARLNETLDFSLAMLKG